MGGNIFLSMAGCMYQNYGHSKLLPFLTDFSATQLSAIIAGTSNPLYKSLSPELKAVVIEQITEVMSYIWAVMIAGAAINVVLGPFLGVSNPHPFFLSSSFSFSFSFPIDRCKKAK